MPSLPEETFVRADPNLSPMAQFSVGANRQACAAEHAAAAAYLSVGISILALIASYFAYVKSS